MDSWRRGGQTWCRYTDFLLQARGDQISENSSSGVSDESTDSVGRYNIYLVSISYQEHCPYQTNLQFRFIRQCFSLLSVVLRTGGQKCRFFVVDQILKGQSFDSHITQAEWIVVISSWGIESEFVMNRRHSKEWVRVRKRGSVPGSVSRITLTHDLRFLVCLDNYSHTVLFFFVVVLIRVGPVLNYYTCQ